jgi:hypothetical protein
VQHLADQVLLNFGNFGKCFFPLLQKVQIGFCSTSTGILSGLKWPGFAADHSTQTAPKPKHTTHNLLAAAVDPYLYSRPPSYDVPQRSPLCGSRILLLASIHVRMTGRCKPNAEHTRVDWRTHFESYSRFFAVTHFNSSVGVASHNCLDGKGIESRWEARLSVSALGPTLYTHPSSSEVKERVQLCLNPFLWDFRACYRVNFTFLLYSHSKSWNFWIYIRVGFTAGRWEDNIKIALQEVGCGVWTGLGWLRIETGGGHLWMQ